MIRNQSAFPARSLKNGTLRYWFTLDSGDSAANLTLSANYSECGPQTAKPVSAGGTLYYAELSCVGQNIYPGGQSQHRRELQFRVSGGSTWNAANDPRSRALNSTALAKTKAITLYDGGKLIWGTEPTGTVTDTTAPSVPGTPVAPASRRPVRRSLDRVDRRGKRGRRATTCTGCRARPRPSWPRPSRVDDPVRPHAEHRVLVHGQGQGRRRERLGRVVGRHVHDGAPPDGVIPPTHRGPRSPRPSPRRGPPCTWTASTAGTNPLSGYEVLRVAGDEHSGRHGHRDDVRAHRARRRDRVHLHGAGQGLARLHLGADDRGHVHHHDGCGRHHSTHRPRDPGRVADHTEQRHPHLGGVDRHGWQRTARVRRS